MTILMEVAALIVGLAMVFRGLALLLRTAASVADALTMLRQSVRRARRLMRVEGWGGEQSCDRKNVATYQRRHSSRLVSPGRRSHRA